MTFTKSTIEQIAIDWLQELGYGYAFGPEISFGDVICMVSLCDSLLPKLIGEVHVKA